MGVHVCTNCGMILTKSTLRGGLTAYYTANGEETKNCPKCGSDLKGQSAIQPDFKQAIMIH